MSVKKEINNINLFNINNSIEHNIWNLIKIQISKMYNFSDNIKVTINKNKEITSTTNLNGDICINFYDYNITTNTVENVNFVNFIKKEQIIFYNFDFLKNLLDDNNEIIFFNNIIKTIKKTYNITFENNLIT